MPTPTGVRTFVSPAEALRLVGIRAGWKVVDFGCGVGYTLLPAARFVGPTGRVVGIDILASAVDEARKRLDAAGFRDTADVLRADLARPGSSGLPNDWADLVFLGGILFQSDPRGVLQEAARIVKPGDGRVAVIEWDVVATPFGPPPEQRVDRDVVLAAAKGSGLTLLSLLAPSPSQYGAIFTKLSVGERRPPTSPTRQSRTGRGTT
jgi:SAM-dependent methyltransferase